MELAIGDAGMTMNILPAISDFTATPGLKVAIPENANAFDYFSLFFHEDLVEKICEET